jgi:hypothetical protein
MAASHGLQSIEMKHDIWMRALAEPNSLMGFSRCRRLTYVPTLSNRSSLVGKYLETARSPALVHFVRIARKTQRVTGRESGSFLSPILASPMFARVSRVTACESAI